MSIFRKSESTGLEGQQAAELDDDAPKPERRRGAKGKVLFAMLGGLIISASAGFLIADHQEKELNKLLSTTPTCAEVNNGERHFVPTNPDGAEQAQQAGIIVCKLAGMPMQALELPER